MTAANADADTPMADALPAPSPKPTFHPNSTQLQSTSPPHYSSTKRKRQPTEDSTPARAEEATPSTSSQRSNRSSFPNKKLRTVADALGARPNITARNGKTLGSAPTSTHSSSSGSQREPHSSFRVSVASTPAIADKKPRNGPEGSKKWFYTMEEIEAVEQFKIEFCKQYSITSSKFNEIIQVCTRNNVRFRLPDNTVITKQTFWSSLQALFPHRPHVSLSRFMRRVCLVSEQKPHHWTAEQEDELKALIEAKGTKWTEIGQILGRSADDVTQRWKNRVEHRDKQRSGPWKPDECGKLVGIIREHHAALRVAGHGVGPDVLDMEPECISWGAVSDQMGNIRSRQQCADKWRRMRRNGKKERETRNGEDAHGEKGSAPSSTASSKTPLGRGTTQKPGKQATLSSLWGTPQGITVRSLDLVRDYHSENTPVPRTLSSARHAGQHSRIGSPILGSGQDGDHDRRIVGGNRDAAPSSSVTTPSNVNDGNSVEVGTSGRDESPEVPESPIRQLHHGEDTNTSESSEVTDSSSSEITESIEVPRLPSPLLGESDNEMKSDMGSNDSKGEDSSISITARDGRSASIDSEGDVSGSDSEDDGEGSKENQNDTPTMRNLFPSAVMKVKQEHSKHSSADQVPSLRDRSLSGTPSTSGREGLSQLRRNYRLRSSASRDEHTNNLNMSGSQFNMEINTEDASSSESELESDSNSDDHREMPGKMKPAVNHLNQETSALHRDANREKDMTKVKAENLSTNNTEAPLLYDASRDGQSGKRPSTQARQIPKMDELKRNGKSIGSLTASSSQRNKFHSGGKRAAKLSQGLGAAKINGIVGHNFNDFDDSSTDSEAGDIPF